MRTFFGLIASIAFVLMLSTASYAQPSALDPRVPESPTLNKAADIASWATVSTAVTLDVLTAWRADDRRHALLLTGSRYFVTWAWLTTIKGLADRERPDGSDNLSMPSMHTALACSTFGGVSWRFQVPLAIGTGGGRVLGRKHWLTDTLVGCGLGALASTIR